MRSERILGCLKGIATGDAIGKQTENLSFADVERWYPHGIRGFEGSIGSVIPRYQNNSKRRWLFGETTDDTERTIAVARAILSERRVSHRSVGREMLSCTKSVHPGVKSLWEFHQAADPARVATTHDGCGAAVRVAPVGILHHSSALEALVNDAREASIPTHGGSLAIAAAAATAAAVSAAIDSASPDEVFECAELAAVRAEIRWPGDRPRAFADALRDVRDRVAGVATVTAESVAADCFPDRPLTIVPLALALATTMGSAVDAILLAANVGGDSDSVASIAGGILGAMHPPTVNDTWVSLVERLNEFDLEPLARALERLRHGGNPAEAGSHD